MRSKRMRLSRPANEPAGSPAWVVTYADLVTLLLCVFVGLFSMSAIRPDRFQIALGSLQDTFGSKDPLSTSESADTSLIVKLRQALAERGEKGLLPEKKPSDGWLAIAQTAKGVRIVLAGPTLFDRGRAALSEKAGSTLDRIASVVRGSSNAIIISGHSAGEGVSGNDDPRELSYRRAATVARRLEDAGVAKQRMEVVALGQDHPVLDHAYTEKRRAINRRVEIEIVEGSEPGGAAELILSN